MVQSFKAKLYKINKGEKTLAAYKAIIRRAVFELLNVRVNDGVLLKLNGVIFPSVITKQSNSQNSYSNAFTVPRKIGTRLKTREIKVKFLGLCRHTEGLLRYKGNYIILPDFMTMGVGRLYSFDLKNLLKLQ